MTTCLLDASKTSRDGSREGSAAPSCDVEVPLFADAALHPSGSRRRWLTSDLVPAAEFHQLAEDALAGRDRFIDLVIQDQDEPRRDELNIFRGDDLLHAWRDIVYGQALADDLHRRGTQEVCWRPGRTTGDAPRGELLGQAVRGGFPTPIPWHRLDTSARRSHEGLRRLVDHGWRKVRNRVVARWQGEPRGGRCVAIFATQQWKRFTAALDDLQEHFGKDFVFWFLGRPDRTLQTALAAKGIALWSVQMPATVDDDLEELFAERHQRWLHRDRHQMAEEISCPAIASKALEPFFETYFQFTFPRACQWLRRLETALETIEPEWVIGSAAFTFNSALPLVAADRMGIPSLALSHSYITGNHSPVPGRYLACRNVFERQSYGRTVPQDSRIVFCHNSSDTLSYEVRQVDRTERPEEGSGTTSTSTVRRVALLTASPQLQGYAMPLHQIGPWIDALRALCHPPDDLNDVQWTFKFHPRFDLTTYLEAQKRSLNVDIYPADGSVHDLLADSWLAVLVNHVGGVGIDARLAGVPVVLLDSAAFCYPQVGTDVLDCEVVQQPEALWQWVRELRDDPARYRSLQDHNQSFVEHRLAPTDVSLAQRLATGLPPVAGGR